MKFLITLISIFIFSNSSYANTLLTCDAPKGKGYFYEGVMIPKNQAGWSDDGMSKGSFSLIKNKNKFDILYKDASGALVSSTADGGMVVPLGNNKINFTFLVSYPNITAELFTFNIVKKKLAFSQHKYGSSMMDKRVLFVANCN